MPASSLRPVLLLLLLAVMWSSSFTTIKIAVESIPPITLVAIRMIVGFAILYVLLRWRGTPMPQLGPSWRPYFVLGLTGNAIPFFLISWGEVGIPSGEAAILMAIMPLATILLAHFFTISDRLSAPKVFGVIIGFAGVVILIGPDALTHLGGSLLFELAVAGGAMFYAITAVIARRLPAGDDPIQRSAAVALCAAVQIIPLALWLDTPWTLTPSTGSLAAALYLGVFPTGLAAILHFHLIAERGTTFFASINYIIPAMGLLWGVMFLDEPFTVQGIAALVVILAGVFVANAKGRKAEG